MLTFTKLFCASYYCVKRKSDNFWNELIDYLKALLKLFALLEITGVGGRYSTKEYKSFLTEKVLSNMCNSETKELVSMIESHIKDNFKREDFKNNLKELDADAGLVYLSEYLFAKERGRQLDFLTNNDENIKVVNIEHIMPSSGKNKKCIQDDAGIKSSVEFKNQVEKLGNKILLEKDINQSISNTWFKQKKTCDIDNR